jgi:predicted PurR-regulated permease PerM
LAAEAATLAIGLVGLLAAVPLTALVATWLQPARR